MGSRQFLYNSQAISAPYITLYIMIEFAVNYKLKIKHPRSGARVLVTKAKLFRCFVVHPNPGFADNHYLLGAGHMADFGQVFAADI